MIAIKVAASILIIVAIVCLFKLNPQNISEDVLKLASRETSLAEQRKRINKKKSKKGLGKSIVYLYDALAGMGRQNTFAYMCVATIVMFAIGGILALLIGNPFLAPATSLLFAVMPYLYIKKTLDGYQKRITEELETTLSIITTSYVRNGDILYAVQENLPFIKPPLKEHFTAFVGDATYVVDIKSAILNLRAKIRDSIFEEWCDALLQCQDDRTLKETLYPIVQRLTDTRIVNNDISGALAEARMQYYTMAAMLVGIIPLLYLLNKDWYNQLMFSLPGKITLGVDGIIIFFTFIRMLKITKPLKN